ncbi:MAG: PAS domain-containing protein [Bacteroidota bacterium]|nr:PAS domain-containing protein [Bacteroidota bacterium]
MSEFSGNYKLRVEKLSQYILGLISGEKGNELLRKYQITDLSLTALDVMLALDNVIHQDVDMDKLKTASNKLFNILYKQLSAYKKPEYPKESIFSYLVQDNIGVKKYLADTRKNIKQINKEPAAHTLALLLENFQCLQQYTEHYIVMQNIIFPEIERQIKEHLCLQLMWAFHDDISLNIRLTIKELQRKPFDLVRFNVLSSKVYFNINTIMFREENVLFPIMQETIKEDTYPALLLQLEEFKLAFTDTSSIFSEESKTRPFSEVIDQNHIKLSTGVLSLEQLELIFGNLPLDITFVDKDDEVRYFSSPQHRIFPRTTGIIGRKVQNCHPRDSIHVVNQIVEAFRKGEKSEASFWIKMGPKYVLIKYLALRDKHDEYLGVLEVSQEISDIQKIKGERRLLDW